MVGFPRVRPAPLYDYNVVELNPPRPFGGGWFQYAEPVRCAMPREASAAALQSWTSGLRHRERMKIWANWRRRESKRVE